MLDEVKYYPHWCNKVPGGPVKVASQAEHKKKFPEDYEDFVKEIMGESRSVITIEAASKAAGESATEAERERCASIAESLGAKAVADAIRGIKAAAPAPVIVPAKTVAVDPLDPLA